MADQVVQKPGFSDRDNYPDPFETRNRRVNRFDPSRGGANRTGNRHRFVQGTTIGFTAAGNELTDSANQLDRFAPGQRIDVEGSASNDGADDEEIAVVTAGQLDMVEFPFSLEAAGALITVKVTSNRNTRRFDGYP